MKWNIITDSSCDLFDLEVRHDDIGFASIPFIISVGSQDFVDDADLDVARLVDSMEQCAQASHTSCPSPYAWYEQFEKAEYSIAVTISSSLSGSYNSACTARNMVLEEYPDKKIAVIDSRSTGPEMILIVRKICELIRQGCDFDDVIVQLHAFMEHTHIVFALSSYNNLIKNGRMSKIAGLIAGALGFWGVGIASSEGTIKVKQKARGSKKALDAILSDMKERGVKHNAIVISHCQNAELAEALKQSIQAIWHKADVKIVPTRGLCSYYAERGGLLIGF